MTTQEQLSSIRVGLVAIGRNEGERLVRCLRSVAQLAETVVYVDSGSTDGSVDAARKMGVNVVELDLSVPFTAARARNAGFKQLLALNPEIEFVQFVDGDCEIAEGWIKSATQVLAGQADCAVVCGRRRERFPEQSIYNLLCDIEWDTPVGEAKACGGDAMMRVSAFKRVNGFNPSLIAGEEPELCVRLRREGWKILRVDAEMTLHDAKMLRFGQWWKRSQRAGHAFAEGAWLHGRPPERHWVRETISTLVWGLVLPLVALGLAPLSQGFSLLLLLIYPILAVRVFSNVSKNLSLRDAALYAIFCVVGKFSQVSGVLQFYWRRLMGKQSLLIEYKG
ncbi:MAG: glycosyltransferase [Synechococcales bacterium]|nr:glycosyltransferase [Synechococcales bacterium]